MKSLLPVRMLAFVMMAVGVVLVNGQGIDAQTSTTDNGTLIVYLTTDKTEILDPPPARTEYTVKGSGVYNAPKNGYTINLVELKWALERTTDSLNPVQVAKGELSISGKDATSVSWATKDIVVRTPAADKPDSYIIRVSGTSAVKNPYNQETQARTIAQQSATALRTR